MAAQPDFPYCDLADFTANSLGADLSTFGNSVSNSDAELESVLADASAEADSYCQTSFQYQEISQEMHNWRGPWEKRWEVFPYFGPIRTVSAFKIGVSVNQGAWTEFPISCSPSETVTSGLPSTFGNVFVDRAVGYVQTTYIMLKFGLGISYIATPANPAQVRISYTCGFNPADADPTVYDGFSLPVPANLREGTRHIAAFLVNERILSQMGMGNLDALRVGDRNARRISGAGSGNKATIALDIPVLAKRQLKRLIRSRFV